MKTKKIIRTASKVVKRLGRDLNRSPVGRASRGKRTKGFY